MANIDMVMTGRHSEEHVQVQEDVWLKLNELQLWGST